MPPSLPTDPVKLVVGGSAYRGWYEIDLDSDIFTQADAFSVQAKVPEAAFVRAFQEGVQCDVYVGDDRQMAGVIDDVKISGTRKKTTMELVGRDKGAYFVDCEAKAAKVKNYTLKSLAESMIDPSFGIGRVIVSYDDARKKSLGKKDRTSKAGTTRSTTIFTDTPRARTQIDPGRRIAQILDEHTQRLGITWWMTPHGDLFLGKPNYFQELAYSFRSYALGSALANTNNILEWSVERSITDRYSEIVIGGQGAGTAGIFSGGANGTTTKFLASAQDQELILRGINRKLFLSDSDALDPTMARERAALEMGRRKLSALTINLTVPGFRQDDRLYAIDTLALVKIEEAQIDGVYYVTGRRFRETASERRTQITLHEKGVFLP